jgi:hypothetical protein
MLKQKVALILVGLAIIGLPLFALGAENIDSGFKPMSEAEIDQLLNKSYK